MHKPPPEIEKLMLELWDKSKAEGWWSAPNKSLDGQRPCDLDRLGRGDEVHALLRRKKRSADRNCLP